MQFHLLPGQGKHCHGQDADVMVCRLVLFYILSMIFLAKAIKAIPIGTAYPIWTGIGAVGTGIIGILVFKEPVTLWRMFFIFTLIASVVGLKAVH